MDIEKKKPKVIKRDERKPPKTSAFERMEKMHRAMVSLANRMGKELEELKANGHN